MSYSKWSYEANAPDSGYNLAMAFRAFAIIGAFLLTGCSGEPPRTIAGGEDLTPDTPPPDSISIISLGDSYTIGEAVRPELAFPNQLTDSLTTYGVVVTEVMIVAQTGWTTTELKSAIGNQDQRLKFGLVTLLIGVNNQFGGLDLSFYETEFAELVDKAVSFASGDARRVIVISIPDYGVTPFGQSLDPARIREEIDAYNAKNRDIAESKGTRYINITPISRRALDDPSLVARDGLHPSWKMYAEWVKLLIADALAIVGE